jgi:hypothetical protein
VGGGRGAGLLRTSSWGQGGLQGHNHLQGGRCAVVSKIWRAPGPASLLVEQRGEAVTCSSGGVHGRGTTVRSAEAARLRCDGGREDEDGMRARRQQRRQRRVVQAAGGCGGDEGAGECEDGASASASGSVGLSLYLWLGGRIENENVNRARMGPLLSFLRLHAHAHDGSHCSVDSSSPSALDRLLPAVDSPVRCWHAAFDVEQPSQWHGEAATTLHGVGSLQRRP